MASSIERLPAGFSEKSATVNGVRISYKIGGSGPVVVLLHGYAETSHMWFSHEPPKAEWNQLSHRVYCRASRPSGISVTS